jgi:hypothetical protein
VLQQQRRNLSIHEYLSAALLKRVCSSLAGMRVERERAG